MKKIDMDNVHIEMGSALAVLQLILEGMETDCDSHEIYPLNYVHMVDQVYTPALNFAFIGLQQLYKRVEETLL